MNQLQQKQYTGKGGIYQQLTLPISENILIDEHEPVYVANAQLEELDYTKLYQAYSSKGRKSAAEPRIMFKLLVYGYMCGIYSTRKLELACPKNIDFIWLLQGERVPDYSSFARFRSGKAKDAVEDLFYQFVQRLAKVQRKFTILTCPYTYSILKWVFDNLIFKFRLENFLHQYESIGLF